MRFRHIETVKRTTNESLLPLKVTYEDTEPEDQEDDVEGEDYSPGLGGVWERAKDFVGSRLPGSDDEDEEEEEDGEGVYFDVRFYDRASPERGRRKESEDDVFSFDGYVLAPGLARAIKSVAPYAVCGEPILIEGADGAGKETLARSIYLSSGLSGPFVCVDCGNHSPEMFERALRGTRTRVGLIDQAEGGALYLKDIEKLTVPMQEILLDALEPLLGSDEDEEEVDDVDGEDEEEDAEEDQDESTTQLIASCSPSIKTLLTRKKFDKDLYTGLKVGYVVLPSLRDHPNAILPLFKLFVESAGSKRSETVKTRKTPTKKVQHSFAKDVKATLARLKWPGNYDDLIRCATLVSREMATQPGPITGALIKECLARPEPAIQEHDKRTKQAISLAEPSPATQTRVSTLPASDKDSHADATPVDEDENTISALAAKYLDALKCGDKYTWESLGAYFKRMGFRGKHRIPVARRVVIAYANFITNEQRLIRALGFVVGKPGDQTELQACEIKKYNYKIFLNEIGLRVTTLRHPLKLEELQPAEREWLHKLKRSACF